MAKNQVLSDWYHIAEVFNFNYEALAHAIHDTNKLKSYICLGHIRTGLKAGQIQPYGEALKVLMNMDKLKATEYVDEYPNKVDILYIERNAEELLYRLTEDTDLTSDDLRAMAHALSPIGEIVELLLAKMVLEKKYKEVS